jgi:predicted dehydrogenase
MPARVGVIGCGAIACWSHLKALRDLTGAAVVGGADPDPRARARAARLVNGPIYESPLELLARRDVNAIVITAPPATHAELAIAAARAGKHVYVEKPLATTADDAARAIQAAATAGIIATVGFNYRWHPAHQRARRWLAAGRIGEVRAVQTVFCEPVGAAMPEWKKHRHTGGGVLLDLASHHVDLIRWFLETEVASVRAIIGAHRTEDDTARLDMTTAGGVEVDTFVSLCAGPVDRLFFIGDRGTLLVDRHRAMPVLHRSLTRRYGVRRRLTLPTTAEALLGMRRLVQPSYQPSFRRSLAAFIDRVNGVAVDLPTLDDGAASLAVVLAAEASARQGGAIEPAR